MKVLDVENLKDRPYEEVRDHAWYWALQESVSSLIKRYPTAEFKDIETLFEEENNCKIHYTYEGKQPTVIIFDQDSDYTMFILKWA